MFGARVVALILAILWLWPTGRQAQSEALMAAYRQGQDLFEAGRYEQAMPFYREALELGEREFGPVHPTTALQAPFADGRDPCFVAGDRDSFLVVGVHRRVIEARFAATGQTIYRGSEIRQSEQ